MVSVTVSGLSYELFIGESCEVLFRNSYTQLKTQNASQSENDSISVNCHDIYYKNNMFVFLVITFCLGLGRYRPKCHFVMEWPQNGDCGQ